MRKALTLITAISFAAFGCTMNRTPGNGQPVTATPSVAPSATPGSSSGNIPMTSSYSDAQLSADQAAALMKERQAYRGRFLGYLDAVPGLPNQQAQAGPDYATGQFVSPSLYANPEVTVNSSISSQPTPVITSGAGDVTSAVGVAADAFVVPGGAASSSTTGSTATTAAATIGTTTGTTVNVAGVTVGNLPSTLAATGAGNLTPTVSTGRNPSPIAASSGVRLGTGTTGTTVLSPAQATAANATINTSLNPSMASASGNIALPSTQVATVTGAKTAASTVGTTNTGGNLTMGLAHAPIVIPASNGTAPITVTNNNGQVVISNVPGRIRAVRP